MAREISSVGQSHQPNRTNRLPPPEYDPGASNSPHVARLHYLAGPEHVLHFGGSVECALLRIESKHHQLAAVEILEEIAVRGVVCAVGRHIQFGGSVECALLRIESKHHQL